MPRVIEFSLLGVSLLVVIGLIVSGSNSRPGDSSPNPSKVSNDQNGKTV